MCKRWHWGTRASSRHFGDRSEAECTQASASYRRGLGTVQDRVRRVLSPEVRADVAALRGKRAGVRRWRAYRASDGLLGQSRLPQ